VLPDGRKYVLQFIDNRDELLHPSVVQRGGGGGGGGGRGRRGGGRRRSGPSGSHVCVTVVFGLETLAATTADAAAAAAARAASVTAAAVAAEVGSGGLGDARGRGWFGVAATGCSGWWW
jgi:hypothetical protein